MTQHHRSIADAARQAQFLDVIDRDAAEQRFQQALQLTPLGIETVPLNQALGRILAENCVAEVDVPGFDRASVDGFAIQAADSFGISEDQPAVLKLNPEVLAPGIVPACPVLQGTATPIATGGMVPRGADAILMIEHSEFLAEQDRIEIQRTIAPGQFIAFAGSDIARGETALRQGQELSSREIGILAAIGRAEVAVFRRPQVAIFSTGNEIIAPGSPLSPGAIFDSNAAILAAAVTEAGGEAIMLGIVPDEELQMQRTLDTALHYDMVLLSGGTSKGAGDLSYRVVSRLTDPGIVAHGVALKPGKPICLAVTQGKGVVILPGFPTSAIFTFHEFVAPVIRRLAGRPPSQPHTLTATVPMRTHSERGRTEYVMVSLIQGENGWIAYPMGKNSGSVTAFSYADGFLTIPPQTELVTANSTVTVQLIGQLTPADLVIIGSHCLGLDYLVSELQRNGLRVKTMHVGSMGGLTAAKRGECDIAGVHLFDPHTACYNTPFLSESLHLIHGYQRMQGLVFRADDTRFTGQTVPTALANALADRQCTMVNRNAGSGTRILIDQLLQGQQPPGYALQTRSHNAVATAIVQQRADWGVAIATVAQQYSLGFIPLQAEQYDFIVPTARLQRPAVQQLIQLLRSPEIQQQLQQFGFQHHDTTAS